MLNSIRKVFSRGKSKKEDDVLREIEELKEILKQKERAKERTSMRSRYIPEYVKAEIRKRQNNRCAMCGGLFSEDVFEYDHKIPVALGGTSSIDNVQALCANCHRLKTKYDRLLMSVVHEFSKSKRDLIFKQLKRGWLFVGDIPEFPGLTPSWVSSTIETAGFRYNKQDRVMYTVLKGVKFTYLVLQYERGKFFVFKRRNKRKSRFGRQRTKKRR